MSDSPEGAQESIINWREWRGDPHADGGNRIDVQTPTGLVSAGESEFTVRVRDDTTDIEVHASGLPGSGIRPVRASLYIWRGPDLKSYTMPLAAGERTRLVRGQVPARYAGKP